LKALNGENITIYGDGRQTRSFCYVDDLINGFVKLMDTDHGFTGPVNLGNPGEFSMLELAETVLSLTGSTSELIFKDLPEDDPKQRQPDISIAKGKLEWEPKISLKEGLEKTISYFETLISV
jgi:UDP-glucuronate decarboxylase